MDVDERPAGPANLAIARLVRILWRRKLWAFVTLDIVLVAALVLANRADDQFRATAQVRLPLDATSVFTVDAPTPEQVELELETQRRLVTSPEVESRVDDVLGDDTALVQDVVVGAVENSYILEITVTSADAEVAADAANAYATGFVDVVLEQSVEPVQNRVEQLNQVADEQQALADGLDQQITDASNAQSDAQINLEALTRVIDDLVDRGGVPSPEQTAQQAELSRQNTNAQREYDNLVQQQDAYRAAATSFRSQATTLETEESFRSLNRATVLASATVPAGPIPRSLARDLAVAIVLGSMLGAGVALGRDYLDQTVHDLAAVPDARYPLLGTVANAEDGWAVRRGHPGLIIYNERWSAVAEDYRALRTSIEFAGLERPVQTIMVTSARAGEGKSTTLANLAAVMAAAGSRTIVVCCDLRRPRIHELFGLQNDVGLTSVLLGDVSLDDAIQHVTIPGGHTIDLLASGPLPPNPSEVLGAERTGDLLAELRKRYDHVLIDPTPVVPVTDAVVVSRWVDAVLCVVRIGVTRRTAFDQMVTVLDRTGVSVLGVVATAVGSRWSARKERYGYSPIGPTDTEASWGRVVATAEPEAAPSPPSGPPRTTGLPAPSPPRVPDAPAGAKPPPAPATGRATGPANAPRTGSGRGGRSARSGR
jgi:polysaccharide biosynthesis transport protein